MHMKTGLFIPQGWWFLPPTKTWLNYYLDIKLKNLQLICAYAVCVTCKIVCNKMFSDQKHPFPILKSSEIGMKEKYLKSWSKPAVV